MSCQRTCPTPSSSSTIENSTCLLQRLSKRLSGGADCYRAFRQINRMNRHGSGRREWINPPIGGKWK
jgi:hypothetical protein